MKQVDKYFRDRLEHHESQVPADMWERIAPALEENSNKVRPMFWMLSSAGVLLIGGLLAFLLADPFPTEESDTAEGSALLPQNSVMEHTTYKGVGQNIYASDLASADAMRNVLAEHNIGKSGNADVKEHLAGTTESKSTVESNQSANEATAPPTNRLADEQTTSPAVSVGKEFKLVITESHFAGKDKISNENTKITLSKETKRYLERVKALGLPTTSLDNTEEVLGGIRLFGSKAPQCPSFMKERVGFFVDGYISHDFAMKSYSGNDQYARLRTQTESSLYSFGAGVRFSYFLGRGWGLRSGFNYSQVNEKFAYDDPNSKTTKTIIELQVETNPVTGDTISVKEITKMVEVPGRHTIAQTNKYHFIDIPILLFYEFGLPNSPLYFSANAGTYVNLLFQQSGRYISPDGDPISINGDDEYPSPYKTNSGISLYTSLGIHYVLNDNMDLIVEPHIMTQLKSMTRADASIDERFTSVGVNTGIRYKF